MFDEGETICVSPNQYAYHSVPIPNAITGEVTLLSEDTNQPIRYCDSDKLLLVALNPIRGFRNDSSCTSLRNILIEMDSGPLDKQYEYIQKSEIPYSAVVFSGGKSLHFLIALDQSLKKEKHYKFVTKWILNVLTMADDQTGNPSRCIRIPGAMRDGKQQMLLEKDFKGRVKLKDLFTWLKKHENSKPKPPKKREISQHPDDTRTAHLIVKLKEEGINRSNGRNAGWFVTACNFVEAGLDEDQVINSMYPFFEEESDFKEKEWLNIIKSAFKHVYSQK